MASKMAHLLCLLSLLIIACSSKLVLGHSVVESLPGFEGPLPFELETGYVGVDESEDVQLFYYFVKSESNPKEDPLLLWLTGGPGCSAFSAFINEIGPLNFKVKQNDGSLPTLVLNPNSWTKVASILFVDLPVGTGFSYGTTSLASKSTDLQSCDQVYEFLKKWLIDHSEFFSNLIYVGGDSYTGITIPIIVQLISNGSGGSSVRLIEVAQGLKEGKSCIAMILAETLLGLDAFYRGETNRLAGSPLLLQVWLMDKLRVVDSCPSYSARGYFFRQRLVDAFDEGWWFEWMCSLSADRIAWRCPWLNLPIMSYSMTRQPGIQLIGLTHCVFYFPFRILRQFGHDQTCPPEGIEYPATFPIRGAQLARYATAWRTRELLAPAPTFSCTLSDECLDWLNEEAQEGPTLASEASTSSGRGRRDT